MKKITLLLASIFILGCSSDSDSNGDNPDGPCGTVTITNVTQDIETFTISWQSQGSFNYFEIGYDVTGNVGGPIDNNTSFSYSFTSTNTSSDTDVLDAETINFFVQDNETISFYIRAQCANGELTNWQGPFVLDVDSVCIKPENLNVFGDELTWDFSSFTVSPSYFQVEYGLQGFTIGTGTQITTNDEYVEGLVMEQGNVYDFYVRTFCTNNLGFSEWAGPVSYFAEQDFNLCNPPSNVQYFIEYISGSSAGVRFEWDYNGESEFEHVLVGDSADPNSGTISTSDTFGWPVYTGLSTFVDYDFYVRGVCFDGTRTPWVGPLDVNP